MTHSGHTLHHYHIKRGFTKKENNFQVLIKNKIFRQYYLYCRSFRSNHDSPTNNKNFLFSRCPGVSFITYLALNLFSCVCLLYGIVHKERPIIISNILWILTEVLMVIEVLIVLGVVLYGKGFL